MSVYNLWDKEQKEPVLKSSLSKEWNFDSPVATPRSSSPPNKVGETIFNNYIDLIRSKSNLSTEAKQTEPLDRPFDFFDDEEFAFGINLLNKNVACVGDNMTKLIQMAQEPWPDNVKLYQPYEVEQILLPDNASCLAVQAFLKMCNLPFEVEMRWNAEFMSPSGRVPFIKCGAFVVSELEPIVQFVANKGVSLCGKLTTEEKAEMRAYMSLITNVLVNAELYISWLDNETFNSVTKIRNSSVYPWPLSWLQTRSKRNSVAKRLKALHWHDKTLDQVLADVEQCCNSLSQRLGDRDFFFGTPTPMDALVFGHMRALLSATGPKAAQMIKCITSMLLRHTKIMSRLTNMRLTPQEDYLISQALQLCLRARTAASAQSVSERSSRARRGKRAPASAATLAEGRDVFGNSGFKPFNEIIIMTTKEGELKCQSPCAPIQEHYEIASDIIEDVMEKVDEISTSCDEKHDFEVIVMPTSGGEADTEVTYNAADKYDDVLDTIDENEISDVSTLETDDIKVMNDESGIEQASADNDRTDVEDNEESEICASSGKQRPLEMNDIDCNYGDYTSSQSKDVLSNGDDSVESNTLTSSIDSKTILEFPSNEEISVESLMKYLRKRNALYENVPVDDID